MTPQQTALEHLQVIRSLMERAHIYRTISAPAALIGGCLALGLAIWGVWISKGQGGTVLPPLKFLGLWFGVLAVTALLNTILLARDAKRRGQPFISDGMRTALRAFLPPMLVGGLVGIGLVVYLENMTMAAFIWILCYGLALVSTASFSPPSLVRLGWAFVLAGLALFWQWASHSDIRMLPTDEGPACIAMGLTFGLLHVIYGLAVALSRKQEAITE